MADIEKTVALFMDRYLPDKSRPIGLALSGGADSVALALALKAAGREVICLHVNFGLRDEESDCDAEFCRDFAREHGLTFRQLSVDAAKERQGGESIEMACRRLRYDWFEQMARKEGLQCVAVAHHSDDNEETMLLNLLRGTGVAGLRGMQSRRGIYVRPLLSVGRADIEAYLKNNCQCYRVDSSNSVSDYRRNALRNEILPLIRRYFPDADRGLLTTIAHMADVDKLLNKQAGEYIAQRFTDGKMMICATDESEILVRATTACFPPGVSHTTAADILRNVDRNNARFQLNDGSELLLFERELMRFQPQNEVFEVKFKAEEGVDKPMKIVADVISAEQFHAAKRNGEVAGKRSKVAYFDADALEGLTLTLRNYRRGDAIRPFGMVGKRLVSDLLKEARMSQNERNLVAVVTDEMGELLWVVGVRASELHKVTSDTKKVLCLQLSEN